MGSLAGICTGSWSDIGREVWRRSSRALERRNRTLRPRRRLCATQVIELRRRLCAEGLDAGPVTIGWHLEQEGLKAPSTSTIRRILNQAGLIIPEPRKRPRSSYLRFEAAQPNEMWQSDFMHARLADGGDVEILSWLDDHSRFLLRVHRPPARDRRHDRRHVPSNHRGSRTARQHPDRQRPRLHRPVRRWQKRIRIPTADPRDPAEERLARPPTNPRQDRTIPPDPATLARRPTSRQHPSRAAAPTRHVPRALQRASPPPRARAPHPRHAYRATPKALPARPLPQAHYRLRYDRLDKKAP